MRVHGIVVVRGYTGSVSYAIYLHLAAYPGKSSCASTLLTITRLLYVFRLMTCDAYYTTHPEPSPGTDRCSNREIEASTSLAFSLLAASTTVFGVLNLFVTNYSIKRLGIKTSLAIQVFWPAVRLLVQNIGVMVGGETGITIIQCSQIMTIVGGPSGYLLSLNSFVAEVVEKKERTGALGRLQGCTMFGTSFGYLIGGILSDAFDITFPFKVTLGMFCVCSLYVIVCLPTIVSTPKVIYQKKTSPSLSRFFGPLKMFVPQKWLSRDGVARSEYGALILGIGVFFGILATGYIPILLQMYSTGVLGFGTSENSYLVSLHALTRGCFLTFLFPRIISLGRSWFQNRKNHQAKLRRNESLPFLPGPIEYVSSESAQDAQEPSEPDKPSQNETFDFDLFYTKFSLLLDGLLTGIATFVQDGTQIYFIAALIALASGTGSAAKGTILQMCPGNTSDALSAITLVDMIARLSTTTLFGLLYALLAKLGRPELIFTVNAVCHFPCLECKHNH